MHQKLTFSSALATLCLSVMQPVAAQAEAGLVVVELYTSQGCSSCPPADELLAEMAKNSEVLPLAFHVDYWDYLGWKDELGNPAFTARQKDYAHAAGERMIYTPQAIVNGKARLVGSDNQALMSALMHEMNQDPKASLTVARTGATIAVSGVALAGLEGPLQVVLVRYRPVVEVEIRGGENAGQTISYVNTVTGLTLIGEWAGDAPLSMTAPVSGDDASAVLLQETGMGAVVAAARVP